MLQNNMNFYKWKFVFVSLIYCLFLIYFLLLSPNKEITDEIGFCPIGIESRDTTETIEITAKVIKETEENITLKDHGSPKTVNFILYLIYRFTFKNVN